jgi:hypothetical protein
MALTRTISLIFVQVPEGDQFMPSAPDKIPENVDFVAQELLDSPTNQRPAMLEDSRQGADQALAAKK